MTLAATVIGLVLVFEDTELGTFAVLHDGRRDLRACDERTTEFNFLALADSQHFLERDGRTFLGVELSIMTSLPSATLYCLPPVLIIAYKLNTSTRMNSPTSAR